MESDELEVIEVMNSGTNQVPQAIVEKTYNKNKNSYSTRIGCEGSIKRGYWYDGYDCFVFGTIITDDNCVQLFIPADAATQYLLTDCGWSNVP